MKCATRYPWEQDVSNHLCNIGRENGPNGRCKSGEISVEPEKRSIVCIRDVIIEFRRSRQLVVVPILEGFCNSESTDFVTTESANFKE